MPRKKRNKRNRRGNGFSNRESKQQINGSSTPFAQAEAVAVTPINISINNMVTPLVTTPSPKIQNNSIKFHRNVTKTPVHLEPQQDLDLTPVNHHRSCKRTINEGTPNYSNINILFNLDSPLLSSRSARTQVGISPAASMHFRSNSCISKLHSPGIEKVPIKVNVATQTTEMPQSRCITHDVGVQYEISAKDAASDAITETPRISQVLLIEETSKSLNRVSTTPEIKNVNVNNLDEVRHLQNFEKTDNYEKITNVKNLLMKNPYCKLKNTSNGEISFFASHLYNLKSSSTPIEFAPVKNVNLQMECLDAQENKENFTPKFSTPKNQNLPLKLLNNDGLLKHRPFYSASPRVNRFAKYAHLCNRSHNISHLRLKSPHCYKVSSFRKSSVDIESVSSQSSSLSVGVKLYLRMKMFGRRIAGWGRHLVDLCNWFGITIKKVRSCILDLIS